MRPEKLRQTTDSVIASIRRLPEINEVQIDALADVLLDCVEGGASVSFMLPLTRERARVFWRGVAEGVSAGKRLLLVAEDHQGLCGCVQLSFGLPENQPHRADVSKMLVHRRARRQGLGADGTGADRLVAGCRTAGRPCRATWY